MWLLLVCLQLLSPSACAASLGSDVNQSSCTTASATHANTSTRGHTAASESYLWVCNTPATFIWGLWNYVAIKINISLIYWTSSTHFCNLFHSSFLIHRHRCITAAIWQQNLLKGDWHPEVWQRWKTTFTSFIDFQKLKQPMKQPQKTSWLEKSHRWPVVWWEHKTKVFK